MDRSHEGDLDGQEATAQNTLSQESNFSRSETTSISIDGLLRDHAHDEGSDGIDEHHYHCPNGTEWGEVVTHHYHHQHCPTVDCPATGGAEGPSPDNATAEAIARLEQDHQRLESHIAELTLGTALNSGVANALRSVSTNLRSAVDALSHIRAGTRRNTQRRSGRQARSPSPGWEPIAVYSPSRDGNSRRRSQPRGHSPQPPAASANSAACPQNPEQQDGIPAFNPNSRRISLQEAEALSRRYPISVLYSTKTFFYVILRRIKEHYPNATADEAWERFVARIVSLGVYNTEAEIDAAWLITFGVETRPEFNSLWARSAEWFDAGTPPRFVLPLANLIRFGPTQ